MQSEEWVVIHVVMLIILMIVSIIDVIILGIIIHMKQDIDAVRKKLRLMGFKLATEDEVKAFEAELINIE